MRMLLAFAFTAVAVPALAQQNLPVGPDGYAILPATVDVLPTPRPDPLASIPAQPEPAPAPAAKTVPT